MYKKKNLLILQLYNCEQIAFQIFDRFWFSIKQNILEKLSKFIKMKYQNLYKKLNELTSNQNHQHQNIHEKGILIFMIQ